MKKALLIDYENIQPHNIHLLHQNNEVDLYLFIGATQEKLIREVQEYIETNPTKCIHISETGKNALDFHIAYYLSELKAQADIFFVLSKDKGYDPLIHHINEEIKQKHVRRIVNLEEMMDSKPKDAITIVKKTSQIPKPKAENVLQHLCHCLDESNNSRPRKLNKLQHHIQSKLQNTVSIEETNKIIKWLLSKNLIRIDSSSRISYADELKFISKTNQLNDDIKQKVLLCLSTKKIGRPKKEETLRNWIQNVLANNITPKEINTILAWLEKQKKLKIQSDKKIVYLV